MTEAGVRLTRPCGHAATRLLDGDNLHARGRVPVQVGHRSVNALEQKVYTRSGASDAGGELNMTMPPRPRSCADRPPTSLLGACGSAVAAGGMSAQRGGMGACAAQAVAVRLPRLLLVGAASHEHVLHVRTTATWSKSTAETCGSIGGMLGSRCMSNVHCTRAP